MAESYAIKAVLSALDKGFTSALNRAKDSVDTLDKTASSGIGFGILAGIGQQAFSAITSGVSNLIGEINSSNAAWKTFTGNMEMLGKSESDIAGVKKELQEFAQQTVYSSSDMASTFAQLEAVGVKNTTALVKGFGGLAAASENPQQAMKTLSTQATQMAAKPTVAWQDFKLMLEQTPAGIAAVAKHMGMSTAEMVAAVQDGSIATDEFLEAIAEVGTNKDFSKLATEAKTVGQAMDGLKETVGNKLTPAFDVISQTGIKAINALADSLEGIDAQGLANTITNVIETVKEFIGIVKGSFSGVGKSIGSAFSAIKSAMGDVNGSFSKTSAMEKFKSVCDTVAGAIKKVAEFLEKHADTVAKVLPIVGKIAGAFAALMIVNAIAPGLTSFAGSLLLMAGKGIVGLAAKLFGVALGQEAVGTASASSGPSILQSAVATLALAAAVALAAVGLALIVQSAIALAAAGWPAVAALVGLVAVIALLAIGAAALGPALTAGAIGFIAFGGAIALIGVGAFLAGAGLALIAGVLPMVVAYGAQAAVALVQLGAGLAVFAVGAALTGAAVIILGAGLLIVASALVVAGAAMILFGVGALLAAASLALLSLVLPTLVQYGLQGSIAIMALGAALVIFGAGALVAGAGALVLGAGLLVCAAAVAVIAAAFLVLSVGALITAASLALLAVVLPLIAQHGAQGATAIALLGAAMLVFAVGATVASVAALALSIGLIAASVGIAVAAVTIGLLAASMTLLAVSTLLAAAGFGIIASAILTIISGGMLAAMVLTSMNLPLLAFVPAATVAGAAALVLAAGFTALAIATAALGIAMVALGVGLITVGVGAMLAAAGFALMALTLPLITANATQNALALAILSMGLSVFAIGAGVAGAAALVLGAGLALMAVSLAVIGVSALVTAAAILLMGVGCTMLAGSLSVAMAAVIAITIALPLMVAMSMLALSAFTALMAISLVLGATLLVVSAAMLVLMGSATITGVAIMLFGTNAIIASVGILMMATALKTVQKSMSSIAKNATKASKALDSMQDAVSIVEAGLDGLASMAESAMDGVAKAFKGAASDARSAGQQLAQNFTSGMQIIIVMAPAMAMQATALTNNTLRAGQAGAYAAGAYISIGFANGMLSCLGTVRSAASKIAAEADKAVRAKAKIASPSRVAEGLGSYFGEGFAIGIADMAKEVWNAAESLVAIPAVATPDLASSYSGELSADYNYANRTEYTIVVPLNLDKKEVGRAMASTMQDAQNREQKRTNRKYGLA